MISKVSEEAFKDATGVSYSRLSNLADGPQAYQRGLVDDKESSAMALGTVVDIKLTQPERFEEEIYVMTAEKPNSEMMLAFCEVYAETDDQGLAYESSGYNISLERVMKKFDEDGKDYYDALVASGDKTVISAEDFFKANQIVTTLKSNPYTRRYFVNETPGIELMFQVPLLWTIAYKSLMEGENGRAKLVNAKSLLDVIRIDHNNKTIQPIELKTGAEGFYKSYRRFKRHLQGTMYHDAVISTVDMSGDHEGYVVEPLRFIYADTNLVYAPTVYKMSPIELDIGRNGKQYTVTIGESVTTYDAYLERYFSKYKVKGYKQLVAELEWHEKNNLWDYSYEVYQNNGEIDLDTFVVKY